MNLDDNLGEKDRVSIRIKMTVAGQPELVVAVNDMRDWATVRRVVEQAKVSYYRHIGIME